MNKSMFFSVLGMVCMSLGQQTPAWAGDPCESFHVTTTVFAAPTVSSPADKQCSKKSEPAADVETITFPAEFDQEAAAKESKAAVDRFLKAWNTGDNATLRKAVNYPLITVHLSGEIQIAKVADEFETPFEKMRTKQKWDHSQFDKIEPIYVSRDKAHYKVAWSRYNNSGQRYLWGDVIYVVTKREGRWAVSVRSVFGRTRIMH